jgi:hypothetical protein
VLYAALAEPASLRLFCCGRSDVSHVGQRHWAVTKCQVNDVGTVTNADDSLSEVAIGYAEDWWGRWLVKRRRGGKCAVDCACLAIFAVAGLVPLLERWEFCRSPAAHSLPSAALQSGDAAHCPVPEAGKEV